MQRFLARTARTKRIKESKIRRSAAINNSMKAKDIQAQRVYHKRQMALLSFRAIKIADEDWALGPLAPRRDVGKAAEQYGTMDEQLLRQAPPTFSWQRPLASSTCG